MKLKFIADPSHGWLSVSHKQILELNIQDKISQYSYMNLTRVFLEEDCDAQLFIDAAKAAGYEVKVKEPSSWSNRPSWVRSLGDYNPSYLTNPLKEGDTVWLYGVISTAVISTLSHFSKYMTVKYKENIYTLPYSNPMKYIRERVTT